jgi:hypothetical protein
VCISLRALFCGGYFNKPPQNNALTCQLNHQQIYSKNAPLIRSLGSTVITAVTSITQREAKRVLTTDTATRYRDTSDDSKPQCAQ